MAKRKESRPAKKTAEHPINGETLRVAVSGLIEAGMFSHLKRHGNISWNIEDLILLAMVWVWSSSSTLTGAFSEARRWSLEVLGRVCLGTYPGFLKALATWTERLLPVLWACLHQAMEKHGGKHWRVGRWLALAVDGSRVSAPRTKDNEKAFCAPNYGHSRMAAYRRKKNAKARRVRARSAKTEPIKPQIWVTLLWHMGLQMPFGWKTGPSHASERGHLQEIMSTLKFPENTLFCCDAGFTGYELWSSILNQGHSFLIRVGANVRLLRKLGFVREARDTVYFWPDREARRKQPPFVLRMLRVQVGKCTMVLVTNVLDEAQLSEAEAVKLYRLRWGVELQFRAMKQTFGRRKLRSRTPQHALVELDWSLAGLWMIQLFAVKEQVEIGEAPEHCSVGLAIHIVRETVKRWHEEPRVSFGESLQAATKDRYERKTSKKARYQPNYKERPSNKFPNVILATKEYRALLRRYLESAA